MSVEVKVPPVGESIAEVIIGDWLVAEGQWVAEDEPVVVVESDKVNLEVPALISGVLTKALKPSGETATIGEVIGRMEAAERPADAEPEAAEPEPAAEAPGEARISPAARRVLGEAGVDAAGVVVRGGLAVVGPANAHQHRVFAADF